MEQIKQMTGMELRSEMEENFDIFIPLENSCIHVYNGLILELFGRIKQLEERIKEIENEP